MRVAPLILSLVIILTSSPRLNSQQSATAPQRDPQAINILTKSLAAMGSTPPADSAATGSLMIAPGSRTETGTIRILTRGVDQTAEYIKTPTTQYSVIFSRGRGNDSRLARPMSMELALTSQSAYYPLPLIIRTLNDPESAALYLGNDEIDGQKLHHLRVWSTFASRSELQQLAEVSKQDLWVDAQSFLTYKIAFLRRATHGPGSVSLPVEVLYSDYRNIGGALYPFTVSVGLNGTPWATIEIQNVAFNSGLTDSDFPVFARRAQ